MKNFDKIKQLKTASITLRDHKENYIKEVKLHNIDKFGRDFNGDTRFSVFTVKATFCSHTGAYGSSSCSTFRGLGGNDIAQKAFTNYLNENMESVIQWMAKDINNTAVKLTDEATKEVNECLDYIKELKSIE